MQYKNFMAASGSNSGPGTADIELGTMTSFQQGLHYEAEVYTPFGRSGSAGTSDKRSWNTPSYDQLRSSGNADGGCTFYVNRMYHFLGKINYCQSLPELTVLPKYKDRIRICWPHNVPHMLCYDASLMVNDKAIQTFNTTSFDAEYQMFCVDKDIYDFGVGNISMLNEWTDHLPLFPICWEMPWFCGKNESMTIPITLSKEAVWTFHLRIQTNLGSLLRVQGKTSSGEWKQVKFNPRWFVQCEQGKTVTIQMPNLHGCYSKVPCTEEMLVHLKVQWNGKMHVNDYMTISSNNPQSLGEKVPLELPSHWPVTDIFVVTENVRASKYNNVTNRGTHPVDGVWGPCKNITMLYGGAQRFSLPHHHLDRGALRNMYPGKPTRPGYYVYPLTTNPATTDVTAGRTLSLHKATMAVELGDTNPLARDIMKPTSFSDSDNDILSDEEHTASSSSSAQSSTKGYPGEKEVQDSTFRVHVLLRHTRELQFIKDKVGFYINCQVTQQPQLDNVGIVLMEQIIKESQKELEDLKRNTQSETNFHF